jgi:Undecaprenyl-phosphate glucose phosphotransferase
MSSFEGRNAARVDTIPGSVSLGMPGMHIDQAALNNASEREEGIVKPVSLTDPVVCAGFMAVDAFVMFLGSLTAWFIYHQLSGAHLSNWRFYAATSMVFAMIFVANGLRSSVYGFLWGIEKPEAIVKTFRAFVQTFLFFVTLLFFVHWADAYSRITLVMQFFICGTLVLALRSMQLTLLQRPDVTRRLVTNRVMLVGLSDEIEAIETMWRDKRENVRVVRSFPMWLHASENAGSLESLGKFAEYVIRESRQLRLDRIVILLPAKERIAIDTLTERLAQLPASILVSTESLSALRGKPSVLTFGGLRMLRVVRKPLSATDRIIKRTFDFVTAFTLLVGLLPVLALAALAIKLDSGGPVLFVQARRGFNERRFLMFKFRTMQVQGSEVGFVQTRKGDPRITRVGKLLRRWNIDELPQLFNVLLGEMSLVGPRPHAVEHDDEFGAEIAVYARRHNMKPGITGLAQVSGFRGATDSLQQMEDRVSRDLAYIEDWSLFLDLKILLMTVFSPRAYRNAY